MKPISFKEQNTVFAKDQPQYLPLPAYRFIHESKDLEGQVIFCWKASWKERLSILFKGLIWHRVLTFKSPLQPQMLQTEKPVFD